jgi:hypothetical protein
MKQIKQKLNPIQYTVEQLTDPLFNTVVLQNVKDNLRVNTKLSFVRISSLPISDCGK